MAAADDVRSLRDAALANLAAVHDYFIDTKFAWRFVLNAVGSGSTFVVRNQTTGSVTTHQEFAGRAQTYVAGHLTEATFQQFLSIFENFFTDILTFWLNLDPRSLGGKKIDFKDVLAAPDKDAVTREVVRREVNDILYGRLEAWFSRLEQVARLGCPSAEEIGRLAEAKATRDILVHNRGIANAIYESKAGPLARYKSGDRVEIPDHYHRETWELIRKVVAGIADRAAAKVG